MVFRAWAHERRHKTRNGWYLGLVGPISSIVGLLILYIERAESLITKR